MQWIDSRLKLCANNTPWMDEHNKSQWQGMSCHIDVDGLFRPWPKVRKMDHTLQLLKRIPFHRGSGYLTFQYNPCSFGVRITHEISVILSKCRHSRHHAPVVRLPCLSAHVKHKNLDTQKLISHSPLISVTPCPTTKNGILITIWLL